MTFDARKLEIVLKEVNTYLINEGVLKDRLTQDIWTKLMSNLMQGEYQMALPIRQSLQKHIRAKRPDKINTFNQVIHKLDEILDRYITPPDLSYQEKERKQKRKQKRVQVKENVEHVTQLEDKYENEISQRQYFTIHANQSVLMATVDEQQMKIKALEDSVSQLERKNAALIEKLHSASAEKGDKIDVCSKVEREIKFLKNELKIKESTLQLSLIERNELLDRLSAVTSSKMVNGNTNIKDFGDMLRPSQIADKYSKLFECEWTDAFHLLTLEMKEEKTIIHWLFDILADCYWFCANTNESQTKQLITTLLHPVRQTSETKVVNPNVLHEVSNSLLTNLKQLAAKDAVSQVQVQFLRTMQLTKKTYYEEKTAKKLTSYIDKCVEICWYMVNQDPLVLLDDKLPQAGDEFNRDVYKFYKKSGSKVEYVVWPALYLGKEGYLLVQGVAQPKQEGVALRIASSKSTRSLNI